MKRILFILLLIPVWGKGQIITTIAGNGVVADTGDGGPATAAAIAYPVDGEFDKYGNYYFATSSTGNVIRKISATGIITTVAGTGIGGYNGDDIPATTAQINNPQGVAVDSIGNFYFTDNFNYRIRKVNVATGIISTVGGSGTMGFSGDGMAATAAQIHDPLDICIDKSDNLYFADYANNRVRKISTSGIISTFAGGGGGSGDGGPATAASIFAWGLCTDNSGNVYIADGSKKVYKVNSAGNISIYAGTSVSGHSGDGGPATAAQTGASYVKMDKFGNLFISEYSDNTIRLVNNSGIISTIAGSFLTGGYSGDGGPASTALLNYVGGLTLDSCDNLYIADGRNCRIRKITYPHCNYESVKPIFPQANCNIYPNPATTSLTITSPNKITQLTITNLLGQTVYTHEYNIEKVQVD